MENLSTAFHNIFKVFTQHDLHQYFNVFAFFFVAAVLLSKYRPGFTAKYLAFENKMAAFLKERELFYREDVRREEIWLNVLRVVAGFIFLTRSFWVFYYEMVIGGNTTREVIAFIEVCAAFSVFVGFLTPIGLGIKFFFSVYVGDQILNIYTLGSCAAQILTYVMLFTPTGRYLSVDAQLLKSNTTLGRFTQKMYAFIGEPTVNRVAIVKFGAFISYGLLCLYSVYGHFLDPYWANGTSSVMFLTSSWLTGPYEIFRWLFNRYGENAILVSMVLLYTMMLWETVIIPFGLMKGLPRLFVIWWGLAFLLMSRFVLQLSWLPHYQFTLFAILFWPGLMLNFNGRKSLELFYDDKCNLCDKTLWLVNKLDWFGVVLLKPMSKNAELIRERGFTDQAVFDDLHGYDAHSGRAYVGYNLYVELTKRIFALVVLFPVLFLGKITKIGPVTYRFIAERRRKVFGICQIPSVDWNANQQGHGAVIKQQKSMFFMAFMFTYAVFLVVYMIRFPYFNKIPGIERVRHAVKFVGVSPSALNGAIPLLVFTPNVIYMGGHYFTVTGVFKDGSKKLLPYVGKKGERLALVNKSDRLYFGNSLVWRRLMYDKFNERVCYDKKRDDKILDELFKVAAFTWGEKPSYYQVDYYHHQAADPKAAANLVFNMPKDPEHVCTVFAKQNEGTMTVRNNAFHSATLNA